MGAEAYGLVGFFTMLQAWFALLDLGLTPTIGRETARYRGGAMSSLAYRQLFRALSMIFASIALIGGCGLWLFAEGIASRWLKAGELPMSEVILAVQIMAVSVSLRWMGGLYRGVISGFERLVWLSGFNAFIATLRFIAVFLSMWLYGFTPYVFFIHQLVVALLEVASLFLMSRLLLPGQVSLGAIGWSIQPVKPFVKFATTIAFTSAVWILVTQTDKLILSGILSLAEYGYFTLAVLVASGVMVISGPISSVIMPRMARLHSEGKADQVLQIYRNATRLVSVVCGSAAITIFVTAETLLFAWTGDRELAKKVAPMLRLYVAGNAFLVFSAFPYYLQYAFGNLRYHLIGNIILAFVLVPAIIFSATLYGGIGAGWVWLILNSLWFFVWVGYIHVKLNLGIHMVWLCRDILAILIMPLLLAFAIGGLGFEFSGRLESALWIVIIFSAVFLISLAGLSFRKIWFKARYE